MTSKVSTTVLSFNLWGLIYDIMTLFLVNLAFIYIYLLQFVHENSAFRAHVNWNYTSPFGYKTFG